MPGDLLRYLAGPTGYSPWWWLLVGALALVVVFYYTGVYVWTAPPTWLRRHKVLGGLHRRLVARRFSRAVRVTTDAYRAGALSTAAAATAYARTLRAFLRVATGMPAAHLHVDTMAAGPLAPAAPLIAALDAVRFDTGRHGTDITALGTAVGEAIRSWT